MAICSGFNVRGWYPNFILDLNLSLHSSGLHQPSWKDLL